MSQMTYKQRFGTSQQAMQRIGFIVYPGFQVMGLAAATVFEIADLGAGRGAYDVRIVSEAGGRIAGSGAIAVDSAPFGRQHFDTLVVCGGIERPAASAGLIDYLRRRA